MKKLLNNIEAKNLKYYLRAVLVLVWMLLIIDEKYEITFVFFSVGVGVSVMILYRVFVIEKEYKIVIEKAIFMSSCWMVASIVLVDWNEIDWNILFKIVTSCVYIFLACLIPEYISLGKDTERERM